MVIRAEYETEEQTHRRVGKGVEVKESRLKEIWDKNLTTEKI